jgi:hypothetical protein
MIRTKMNLFTLGIMMFLLAVVTACGPATDTPANLAGTAVAIPEQVMSDAQTRLSEALGIPVESIQIDRVEDAEWADACLELAQEGENCAQVITPGYLIVLTVDGQNYEIHTNADGNIIRLNQ